MLALPASRFCTKLTSWWSAIYALATCKAGGRGLPRFLYRERVHAVRNTTQPPDLSENPFIAIKPRERGTVLDTVMCGLPAAEEWSQRGPTGREEHGLDAVPRVSPSPCSGSTLGYSPVVLTGRLW